MITNFILFLFFKLVIFIAFFLKNSKKIFIQSYPLYASSLFYMLLDDDSVNNKKPNEISLLTFVADEFSGLFLQPSILSILHSRSALIGNVAL